MLTRYGMSDDFDMVALETVTNQYLGGDASLACSADTQREIDQKVVEPGEGGSMTRRWTSLPANREKLDPLAAIPLREGDHHRRGIHAHSGGVSS